MGKVVGSPRAESTVEHFTQYGHVLIERAYDPDLAVPLEGEIRGHAKRFERKAAGVSTAIVTGLCYDGYIAIPKFLEQVGECFEEVGRSLGTNPRAIQFDLIDMEPGVQGPVHTDKKQLIEAVGITTLAGESILWVKDGAEHPLSPGGLVIMDAARRLRHQGRARPEGRRVGLAVGRRVMRKAA